MTLLDLFLVCLKASFLSFGGSAVLPLLQDELGRQRGLLRDEDFASALAIGRITPGPNGLLVLPIGYFVAGIPGAIVAALALCVVAFCVLILLRLHTQVAHLPIVRASTRGIEIGTLGLLAAVGYIILIATVHAPRDLLIAGIAFLLLAFTPIDALLVLAGAGALGLLGLLQGA
ncbi:MAG TPA: chromate transporter [Chloroflexota bacterium]|nr:chromate transporter [Chloroflexota bacterium]